jgi:DNA-binding NtrC family response regulator
MSTVRHAVQQIPVRTVGVELVRGTAMGVPSEPLERVVIGTAEGTELRLEDPSVSRFHVELSASGAGVRVRDLGATNGVVSGTSYLDDAVVPPGTLLELGGACVRVLRGPPVQREVKASARLGELVCESPAMRRLAHRIETLAPAEVPVLIEGPPGSGKEQVARTLHQLGRAAHPLVVIDCGGLSDTLGTSEIFGHEKGAFTDAAEGRAGALERSGGGTILLDGIEALSPALQPALLGVLERRRFRRMGGGREIELGARVLASSAVDLRREVNQGRFRLDLYYRLAGLRLEVPSLSERLDDLGALVGLFLAELGHGDSHPLASEVSIQALGERSWPQNVRELRALVHERAMLGEPEVPWAAASTGTFEDLLAELMSLPYKDARARFEAAFERSYLSHLTARVRGSEGGGVSAAARVAGLDRAQLRGIARRAGIVLK